MIALPSGALQMLKGRNIAYLTTLMADGSPQVTPVWVDTDGTHVLVNTAEGRLKPKNVQRDPRVAIAVTDAQNPYEALLIRGRAIEVTSQGADNHIDFLAQKYLGRETYPFRQPGEQRLIIRIVPERVSYHPAR